MDDTLPTIIASSVATCKARWLRYSVGNYCNKHSIFCNIQNNRQTLVKILTFTFLTFTYCTMYKVRVMKTYRGCAKI